jgi:hypothetical protein
VSEPVNEAFRSHVTSTTFVLTLGASHIAALAHVAHELKRNRSIEEDLKNKTIDRRAKPRSGPLRRAFAHSATGMNGLVSRGLVIHHHLREEDRQPGKWTGHLKPTDIWTITRAGELVIELLTEAGIWQEFADVLPPLDAFESEAA